MPYVKIGEYLYRWNPISWFYRLGPIEKFTAALCILGAFQVWAFIQSERAFVFPSNIAFADPLDSVLEVMPLELRIEIENSGRSPARIRKLTIAVTHELPPEPEYTHGIDSAQFAFPPIPVNQKISQVIPFSIWPTITARAVGDGNKEFYAFGKIEYGDDYWLWLNRTSNFCFRYIADRADHSKSHFRTCTQPKYTKTD